MLCLLDAVKLEIICEDLFGELKQNLPKISPSLNEKFKYWADPLSSS